MVSYILFVCSFSDTRVKMNQAMFGVWDYLVLISMLLVSSSIGIYYKFTGGKQKTVQVRIMLLIGMIINKLTERSKPQNILK